MMGWRAHHHGMIIIATTLVNKPMRRSPGGGPGPWVFFWNRWALVLLTMRPSGVCARIAEPALPLRA